MNKLFLSGLAALAMLASCNSDEQVDMPASKRAITFKSFVNKSTRATDEITNENISNFTVYAFMENASGTLFSDELVTNSGIGAAGTWTYDHPQYWTPGKNYYFTAITSTITSPTDENTDANWEFTPLTGADKTGQGGVITFTNDGTQDLLYAYKEVTTPGTISDDVPGPVSLEFNHLLSRVKFNFKNSMGNDNTTLVIKSVKITNANTKATMDMSVAKDNRSWVLAADNSTLLELDFDINEDKIANGANKDTDHLYLIPQNQAYTMTFEVDMLHGDVIAKTFSHTGNHAVTMPVVDMQPGYSYVFNAVLTGENIDPADPLKPIVFTVEEVKEWEQWSGTTMPIDRTTD